VLSDFVKLKTLNLEMKKFLASLSSNNIDRSSLELILHDFDENRLREFLYQSNYCHYRKPTDRGFWNFTIEEIKNE